MFLEKGSKFICHAEPCVHEDKLKVLISHFRGVHPKASHVCYAWRSSAINLCARMSDDGEPSGTAGRPLLSQIESADLYEVALICIRYFGGTKLGTSGLIKAYKTAGKNTLNNAQKLKIEIKEHFLVETDPIKLQSLYSVLKNLNIEILAHDQVDWKWIKFALSRSGIHNHFDKIKHRFEKNAYEPCQNEFVIKDCILTKLDS